MKRINYFTQNIPVMEMIVCNCGNSYPIGTKYCNGCGVVINLTQDERDKGLAIQKSSEQPITGADVFGETTNLKKRDIDELDDDIGTPGVYEDVYKLRKKQIIKYILLFILTFYLAYRPFRDDELKPFAIIIVISTLSVGIIIFIELNGSFSDKSIKETFYYLDYQIEIEAPILPFKQQKPAMDYHDEPIGDGYVQRTVEIDNGTPAEYKTTYKLRKFNSIYMAFFSIVANYSFINLQKSPMHLASLIFSVLSLITPFYLSLKLNSNRDFFTNIKSVLYYEKNIMIKKAQPSKVFDPSMYSQLIQDDKKYWESYIDVSQKAQLLERELDLLNIDNALQYNSDIFSESMEKYRDWNEIDKSLKKFSD